MSTFEHISVLEKPLTDSTNLKPNDIAIDCTAGGGGHTKHLLNLVGAQGKVIAIDRDLNAYRHLTSKFSQELTDKRLSLHNCPFSQFKTIVENEGVYGNINAIIADIGVSSPQIDTAERGFSFSKDGPLDMRMSQNAGGETAQDVIMNYDKDELADIFYKYGEEHKSRHYANLIVSAREQVNITSTKQLADIISKSSSYKNKSKKHPATKVFQALRIYVNNELSELESLLRVGFEALKPSGRMAIISFHSLEDRIIKHFFQDLNGKRKQQLPRGLPVIDEDMSKLKRANIIKPFPVIPSKEEIEQNPRARSAKLRVIEKIK